MLRRVLDVRYGYSAPLSRWLREHPQHIRQRWQQHCLPKISWYPCLIKVPKWIKMEIHAWTLIELRLKLKWLLNAKIAKTEGVCCCLRTTCGPCGRASAPMALLFWCRQLVEIIVAIVLLMSFCFSKARINSHIISVILFTAKHKPLFIAFSNSSPSLI